MEPDGSRIWIYVLLILVFALLKGVYTACEYAVTEVNDSKVKTLAETDPRYAKLLKLIEAPQKMMLAFSMQRALSCVMISILAVMLLDAVLDTRVELQLLHGGAGGWIRAGMLAGLLLVTTVLISSLTEQLPKRLVHRHIDGFAVGCVGAVRLLTWVLAPVALLAHGLTFVACKLCGLPTDDVRDSVTEEEIRMMVDAGSEKGTIDNEEKDMIQNVFEFDDLTIDEICVHRTDVDLLWVEDSIEEWEQLIHESRHSYYPVCGETVDDIIGVLDAKDYFRLRTKDRDHVMKEAIKQPYFVPENIKAATLFQNMKKTGNYFAVVLDEYGGMDGIITVRNLIEQLVGDLNDEAEIGQPSEIELISTDTWKIMGSASLDDVAEELKIKLPVDEYETFGGYIFGELGAVPDDGSQFELETDDLWIKVMRVKEHRVENTVVKKLPPKEKGEQEERKERE